MGDLSVGAFSRALRWQELLRLVAENGRLRVPEAAAALGTSEATIRRDFAGLDEAQLVHRTHGGVVATSMAYPVLARRHCDNGESVSHIGRVAAAMVSGGQVIGISGRSCATAVARHLGARRDLAGPQHRESRVTVVTNALNIATDLVLRPHIRTVCLGGVARAGSVQLTGTITGQALENYWLDVLFLETDGLHALAGATAADSDDADVWSRMVRRSQRVVALLAGANLGRRALAHVCRTNAIDQVVTDGSADPPAVAGLREMGVQVHVASSPVR